MLKINLLPIRQLKRRAKAQSQLMGMAALFVLTLLVIFLVGYLQYQKVNGLEKDISSLNVKKQSYTPTLNKIAQLKKDREELNKKTEIIKQLKVDSSLTVHVIDEIAAKLDNQRMWLESLQQQGGSLSLSGVALDNQTIAQFMDNLKTSPFVKDVSLTNSSLKVVSGRNLKGFELRCAVGFAPPPTQDTSKKTDTKQKPTK
jgi:type IV pilus assembly protein PilN